MSQSRTLAPTQIAGLLALLLTGCGERLHRMETTIRPDGNAELSVYHPLNELPEGIRTNPAWSRTIETAKRHRDDWDDVTIRGLKPADAETKDRYFAAWGEFAPNAKFPQHFVKSMNGGEMSGGLIQSRTRKDLLFVTVHDWEETLTDVVEIDDFSKARKELAEWQIALVDETLREALGAEADWSRLTDWLKKEGLELFVELSDGYLDLAIRKTPDRQNAFREKAMEICRNRGLDATRKDGVYFFSAGIVRDRVFLKDKRKLDEQEVRNLLGAFGIDQEGSPSEPDESNRFKRARNAVVERKYGGEIKMTARLMSLATRMIGLYGLFGQLEKFDARLLLPGTIVETNGHLQADGEATWSFTAADAYPFGYRMQARSLHRNAELCERLLPGRKPLQTRRQLQWYVDAVESDDGLLPALKRCAAEGNLAPLDAYRAGVKANAEEGPQRAMARLVKALDLP